MDKKSLLIASSILFLFLSSFAHASTCYLVVDKPGDYNPITISDFAIPLVSQYIEPVEKPGFAGINVNDCQYKISLSETGSGISITLAGRNANSFGESEQSGMNGIKQSVLIAISRARPEKSKEICELYQSMIADFCGSDNAYSTNCRFSVFKRGHDTVPDMNNYITKKSGCGWPSMCEQEKCETNCIALKEKCLGIITIRNETSPRCWLIDANWDGESTYIWRSDSIVWKKNCK